jgi:Ca2+-binding EF-hand superfamily protein
LYQLTRLLHKNVSSEDVDLVFLIFDDDNNGVVDKSEFKKVLQKLGTKSH